MPNVDPERKGMPYRIGMDARSQGQTLRDNPFKSKGFRNSWATGWEKADALIRGAQDAFNEARGE